MDPVQGSESVDGKPVEIAQAEQGAIARRQRCQGRAEGLLALRAIAFAQVRQLRIALLHCFLEARLLPRLASLAQERQRGAYGGRVQPGLERSDPGPGGDARRATDEKLLAYTLRPLVREVGRGIDPLEGPAELRQVAVVESAQGGGIARFAA